MKISLLIATYNGGEQLAKTLESLSCTIAPVGASVELVVVDNNSNDLTREILEAYNGRIPLRIVIERKRGKNAALNTGIQTLETDYVLLSDDDVVFPKEYFQQWAELFAGLPDYEIYGGAVEPIYPGERPDWLIDGLPSYIEAICFAKTLPTESGEVFPGLVFGNNMAVRRDFFEKIMFDDSIGPGTGEYGMGSETEFNRRAHLKFGARAYFASEIIVRHVVDKGQYDISWADGRAIKFGRGRAKMSILEGEDLFTQLWGAPRFLYREWLKAYMRSKLSLSRQDRIRWRWERFELLGRLREYREAG